MKRYEKDGYTITEYDNGAVVKEIIGEPYTPPEPTPPEPMPPSPTEQKLAALQAENETIMLALADIYEAQIVAVK